MKVEKNIFVLLLVFALAFNPVFFVAADDAEELEEDIEKAEDKLEKEQKARKILEQSLGTIQQSINVTQKQIVQTQSKVAETEETIERKESELGRLEEEMDAKKQMLGNFIREVFYSSDQRLLAIVLSEDDLSKTMEEMDNYLSLQENLNELMDDIEASKIVIDREKLELEQMKNEQEKALAKKKVEQAVLVSDKRETQTEIVQKNATIQELQSKLSKLRSSLSSMLGKSYDAKDVEGAAKFASKVTGVRKDFIMGMLVVESDLGRYTGGCTYKQVEEGAEAAYKKGKLSKTSWNTFQRRRDIFKDITKELDLDYKKQKVSCNPASYAGTGGAMGVPQFMPDTWMGYKSSIANTTGHNPPNPWNLTDGVTAMALKLAKVPGVTDHKKSAEKNASKIYLSGGTSSSYNWYADKVQYWAGNYERLLD